MTFQRLSTPKPQPSQHLSQTVQLTSRSLTSQTQQSTPAGATPPELVPPVLHEFTQLAIHPTDVPLVPRAQAKLMNPYSGFGQPRETLTQKNETGLPDTLKMGIENLSGIAMDDVRVHYNSSNPSQLNALAYTQGADIYLSSNQEKHLPHEAWHVIQQKQGRVKPTMQMQGTAINDAPELEQEASLMGEKAVTYDSKPQQMNVVQNQPCSTKVVQRIIREDIIGKGFTGQEADQLKIIMGNSWSNAEKAVFTNGLTPSYFQSILANHGNARIRRKIIEQLNEHYYGIAKVLSNFGGSNFESLVDKGLNNKTVDIITGTPVPSFRATILSLHDVDEIQSIGALGKILTRYPNFEPLVNAQKGANANQLQEVITWLSSLDNTSLAYLQNNNPTFNVLRTMQQNTYTNALLPLLSNFSKENSPADNVYEAIGANGKSYRVGHYARNHTLRGMPNGHALTGGQKTIWPYGTTINDIRTICLQFDQNIVFNPVGPHSYSYTPPLNNVEIKASSSSMFGGYFDQLYPRTGETITQERVTKLSEVEALKNDWHG